MLQKLKNRKESGFTIIEVLIVLAIAGLILLVVFLAVPALQRNSRNTQAKNTASSVLGAVSEFSNNNGGQLPTTATVSGNTVTFTGANGTTSSTAKVQAGDTVTVGNAVNMPASGVTGTYAVRTGYVCNNNAFGNATSRAVAIGFNIETGSGTANQCVES